MIKLISSVRVNSDRYPNDNNEVLINQNSLYEYYINSKHFAERNTRYHLELIRLATNMSDWAALAKSFESTIAPYVQQFYETNKPHDNITKQPYGISHVTGQGALVEFNARDYGLGTFRLGLVAKFVMQVAFRTYNKSTGMSVVSLLEDGKKPNAPPMICVANTGIVDVLAVSGVEGSSGMFQQIRFKEGRDTKGCYIAGRSLWAGGRPTVANYTDEEFWEFLYIARTAQRADRNPSRSNNESAKWLYSSAADGLDAEYEDSQKGHEHRKQVYQSFADAIRLQ